MIKCPVLNKEIDTGDCVIIVDVSEGCIKETVLSNEVIGVERWREICKNCEYHNN